MGKKYFSKSTTTDRFDDSEIIDIWGLENKTINLWVTYDTFIWSQYKYDLGWYCFKSVHTEEK